MKISQFIEELEEVKKKNGDLRIATINDKGGLQYVFIELLDVNEEKVMVLGVCLQDED
jgi:hypothetical protein